LRFANTSEIRVGRESDFVLVRDQVLVGPGEKEYNRGSQRHTKSLD
jgi:hypothetical protein